MEKVGNAGLSHFAIPLSLKGYSVDTNAGEMSPQRSLGFQFLPRFLNNIKVLEGDPQTTDFEAFLCHGLFACSAIVLYRGCVL